MAHLRTMARRRFGSSRPTASNSNAATRITIDTYRLANMGQWLASYKERQPIWLDGASQIMWKFDQAISFGPQLLRLRSNLGNFASEIMVGAP